MWISRKNFDALNSRLEQIQHFLHGDITVAQPHHHVYDSNPYLTYEQQVTEMSKKYLGRAEWGSQILKNIVDLRSSFIIANGVKPRLRESMDGIPGKTQTTKSREVVFINEFMKRNGLDRETPQQWAREAEIEGKFLCRLVWNDVDKQVDARFISWTASRYNIEADPSDYSKYLKAVYKLSTQPSDNVSQYGSEVSRNGEEITLQANEFVYRKFGGRTHQVNDSPPKCSPVLWNIEALGKALANWRKMNSFFASPTPTFKCVRAEDAQTLEARLKAMKWKIGNFITTTADFKLECMSTSGMESLYKEIVTEAQIISGATGIPVHLLGFPDLMSNRAVADNTMETVVGSTSPEKQLWVSCYEEIFEKAIEVANEHQAGLNPQAVTAAIPDISSSKLKELTEVYLPLYMNGAMSLPTLLSHVPDVNVDEEVARIKTSEQEKMKQTIQEMRASGQDQHPHSKKDENK